MRSSRWLLAIALLAAFATAALLGIAIAGAGAGDTRTVLVWALGALAACVATGGWWAIAVRHGPSDAVVERAETASRLAHELKNPLMSIKGLASTGTRLYDQMGDEERRDFFRLIDEEAARLKRVAEQSAEAMRFDAGQIAYDMRAEDLGALVEEVTWSTPHGEHPMTVETAPGIVVEVDRRYLSEAIANLVDNAAKYSPPDAPIDVTAARSQDGTATIEVADHGPGIPLERTNEVFERFARWRPAGYEETPGAGLGLFLARAHVAAHGGTLIVRERDDGGTILRVTLPAEL